MFINLKIKNKLRLLVIVLLVFLMSIGALSAVLIGEVNYSTTELTNNWIPSIILAEEINTLTSDYRMQEYQHILTDNSLEKASLEKKLDAINAQINEKITGYMPLALTDEDMALIKAVQSSWDIYLSNHEYIIAASNKVRNKDAMKVMLGEAKVAFEELSNNCINIVEMNKQGSVAISEEGNRIFVLSMYAVLISIIAAIAISIVLSTVIVRSITKPVSEIMLAAKGMADGKLDSIIEYSSKDEMGVLAQSMRDTMKKLSEIIKDIEYLLGEMANGNFQICTTAEENYKGDFLAVLMSMKHINVNLSDTLGQINQSSQQVANGSNQVASGAQSLSQGATEQASSIQELAANISEVSEQVRNNAENSQQASEKANRVGSEAKESNRKMQDMLNAITDISDSSKEISKIIKTIEDIAFKTNILALNAAVEAARAGTAGKGFAVVAEEVRNLASQSGTASKNTTVLIERSLKSVENGTSIAGEAAKSLAVVVDGVTDVTSTIAKISDASSEQAKFIIQVTQGVEQISRVVQTNSATAEESAAASDELSSQAERLKNLVGRFQLKV